MMSMVTPPVGIGAFFAAAIAKAKPMQTAFVAMRYGWTAYVIPFLFVLSPTLILKGDTIAIVVDVITAAAGVYLISAAAVGWLHVPLQPLMRLLLILAGSALLVPLSLPFSLWFNGLGIAGAAIVFLAHHLAPNLLNPRGRHWRPYLPPLIKRGPDA